MTFEQYTAELTAVFDSVIMAGEEHTRADIAWQTALLNQYPEFAARLVNPGGPLAEKGRRVERLMLTRIASEITKAEIAAVTAETPTPVTPGNN